MAADWTSLVGCGRASGNMDRLQRIAFVEAGGEACLAGAPLAGLVGEFDEVRHRRRAFDEAELRRLRPRRRPRRARKHGGGEGRGRTSTGGAAAPAADPVEQFGGIGGHAGRRRKGARILGRNAVDDREPGLHGRTVAGIGLAGDRRGEDDAAFLLQAHEAVAPGRLIGTDIVAGDRDEASAFGETRKRRCDMAHRGFGEAALDMRRGREGRVHQHHARPHRRIEPVVDLLGVVAGDVDVAEQAGEQAGAGVGDLVQGEPRFRQLGEDRQQAGAGGGFEHQVGRGQHGRFGGDKAERDRRRELLEMLGFLGAAGLRRQPPGKAREHLEHRRGRAGAGAHRRAEFAQEQHLRRFERLVGVFPHPGAFGVGAAERGFHGRAQGAAVERAALPEQLREQGRGMDQARHLVGRGLRQEQREGGRGGSGGGGGKHGISGSEG